jgi:hypothetical protein
MIQQKSNKTENWLDDQKYSGTDNIRTGSTDDEGHESAFGTRPNTANTGTAKISVLHVSSKK